MNSTTIINPDNPNETLRICDDCSEVITENGCGCMAPVICASCGLEFTPFAFLPDPLHCATCARGEAVNYMAERVKELHAKAFPYGCPNQCGECADRLYKGEL